VFSANHCFDEFRPSRPVVHRSLAVDADDVARRRRS
jgi:hypothetical protein